MPRGQARPWRRTAHPPARSTGGTRWAAPRITTCPAAAIVQAVASQGCGERTSSRERHSRHAATRRSAIAAPPTSASSGVVSANAWSRRRSTFFACGSEWRSATRIRSITRSVAAATPSTSGAWIGLRPRRSHHGLARTNPTAARSQPKNHPSAGSVIASHGIVESERIQFWSNTSVCVATTSSPAATNSGCVSPVLRYRVKPTAAPDRQAATRNPSIAARPSGDRCAWTPMVASADGGEEQAAGDERCGAWVALDSHLASLGPTVGRTGRRSRPQIPQLVL